MNLTRLLLTVRVVRAVKKGTGALTTEEGNMDTDPGSSKPAAEPVGEQTLIAFWLFLNPFKVVPDLCGYL